MNDPFLEKYLKELDCELITLLCQGYFLVKSPDCFGGCKACTVKVATKKDSGSGFEVIFA